MQPVFAGSKPREIQPTNKLEKNNMDNQNTQQQVDITKVETVQLKAFAYDLVSQLTQIQNTLNVVNQELGKRAQAAQQPPIVDGKAELVK